MSTVPRQPAKYLVAQSFGAAAGTYDAVAGLQRSVGRVLLERAPGAEGIRRVLDVGAGTGYFSAALEDRYPDARVVALDIAEGMLRRARERFPGPCVAGDAEALPFAARSADLVFSNLVIQWCAAPTTPCGEFGRVLRPGGRLLLATFGPQSLGELRQAWADVDECTHVNDFVSAAQLRESLAAAGFVAVEVRSGLRRVGYVDVLSLMRELKGLGARNLTPDRPRHLVGKGTLARMMAAYPRQPHDVGAATLATFEIITASAIRAEENPA